MNGLKLGTSSDVEHYRNMTCGRTETGVTELLEVIQARRLAGSPRDSGYCNHASCRTRGD